MGVRRVRFRSSENTPQSIRTLHQLLDAQSAAFKKDSRYALLQEMIAGSAPLRKARLTRLAWRLLHEPRLKVQFVDNFIETYRQPKEPFYRLFLELKWDVKKHSANLRSERTRRINQLCERWPQPVQDLARWLTDGERQYNRAAPVCSRALKPQTLKAARRMALWGYSHWQRYLEGLVNELHVRYPNLKLPPSPEILDWMILESLPPVEHIRRPPVSVLKAGWRRAGKRWHPDCTDLDSTDTHTEWFRAAEAAARRLGIR